MYVPLLATDFLRHAVQQYGKKTGVVDGDKRFTYAQFGERVHRLSNALIDMGIKKGDRVAVLDTNSHRLLELHFGVPQIGAILLPINIRLSPREITYVLNDSGARCLVINEDMTGLVERDQLKSVERYIILEGDEQKPGSIPGERYEPLLEGSSAIIEDDFGLDEQDPAEMFYTSGTSGNPKGMLLTHRTLWLAATKDLFFGVANDRTVYLQAIPLFHANCWRKAHMITAVGGRHVMLPQFRPALICELIEREKVNYMEMVPTMADTLTQFGDLDKYDLSSLERIVIGGAPLLEGTQNTLMEKFPWCVIHAGYGMSETSSCGTTAHLKEHLRGLPDEQKKVLMRSQGYADMLTRVRIVDGNGNDVKHDGIAMGEIIMRGNTVIDGYWGLPEETKKTIIDGWLYSGDIATMNEDGYITIVDRKKDIIISGGENIGSVEVENVISSHPAVAEVAVVAAPHEKWGETPAAFIVLAENARLTADELIAYCREEGLSGFKIPRIIEFKADLPKGGTGKVLKSELKRSLWK
ncbi:MAG: long-chain-fatty-acid--CoA ligase [Deltaproteobacteria bacterium]|nr:long-chain-fatty-acid--CoA ligase [Deltaproteobacteria bacterium]